MHNGKKEPIRLEKKACKLASEIMANTLNKKWNVMANEKPSTTTES